MAAYTYPGGQNGQCLMVDNINFLFDSAQTTLENGINIVKLNYANSLTDIDHDYMVVDVFTDSSGYNDTVCTADTTPIYASTGLSGFYINSFSTDLITSHLISYYCTCPANASMGYDTWYVSIANGNIYGTGCAHTCNCTPIILSSGIQEICFNIIYVVCSGNNSLGGSCTSNWHDNKVLHTQWTPASLSCTYCYKYTCSGVNCYCFYCNGTGKCQVSMTCFPNIVLCAYHTNAGAASGRGSVSITDIVFDFDGDFKITTVPIEYSSVVQTSYLSLDKTGAGSITYNIYDATTDTLIGENLCPNTINILDCCVQCHYYRINQLDDGISCIKSYALAAGQA